MIYKRQRRRPEKINYGVWPFSKRSLKNMDDIVNESARQLDQTMHSNYYHYSSWVDIVLCVVDRCGMISRAQSFIFDWYIRTIKKS